MAASNAAGAATGIIRIAISPWVEVEVDGKSASISLGTAEAGHPQWEPIWRSKVGQQRTTRG